MSHMFQSVTQSKHQLVKVLPSPSSYQSVSHPKCNSLKVSVSQSASHTKYPSFKVSHQSVKFISQFLRQKVISIKSSMYIEKILDV